MTIVTASMLVASLLLTLAFTKAAVAAARAKTAAVVAKPRRPISRVGAFLALLALPILGAAFGYTPS